MFFPKYLADFLPAETKLILDNFERRMANNLAELSEQAKLHNKFLAERVILLLDMVEVPPAYKAFAIAAAWLHTFFGCSQQNGSGRGINFRGTDDVLPSEILDMADFAKEDLGRSPINDPASLCKIALVIAHSQLSEKVDEGSLVDGKKRFTQAINSRPESLIRTEASMLKGMVDRTIGELG